MDEKNKISKEVEKIEIEKEKVMLIPLRYLDDFPDHPFQVKEDEEMDALIESIEENGIVTPVLARMKEDGRYELISGHRRRLACKILDIKCLPVIVRDITREEATIMMVDSNLQRVHILPSEKAFAYKMKMDALSSQGKRTDLTYPPVVDKSDNTKNNLTATKLGASTGDSHEQVRRYIRLTELTPELLDLVDEGRIAFRPAVELSYLKEEEQRDLYETIDSEDATPSLAQAMQMKKLSQEGKLDMNTIFKIMTEQKGNQKTVYKVPGEKISAYFPESVTPLEVEKTIIKALALYRQWQRKREADRDAR